LLYGKLRILTIMFLSLLKEETCYNDFRSNRNLQSLKRKHFLDSLHQLCSI